MTKFIKPTLYSLLFFLLSLFILTVLNYIGLITGIFLTILKIILPIITFISAGFMIGIKSNKKGWLNGIEIGLIITIIFLITNLLLHSNISMKLILYYLVLISISTLGSILGINKRKTNLQ